MNYGLDELFSKMFSNEDNSIKPILLDLFNYLDRCKISSPPAEVERKSLEIKLLWILAHYFSAQACSHGLKITYITNKNLDTRIIQEMNVNITSFPSNIKIQFHSLLDENSIVEIDSASSKSDFESKDLFLFSHQNHTEKMSSCLLIDYSDISQAYTDFVGGFISNQRAISNALLLCKSEQELNVNGDGKVWEMKRMNLDDSGIDIVLLSNKNWINCLNSITDIKFSESNAYFKAENKENVLAIPLISINNFKKAKLIDSFPAEKLAGISKTTYYLDENGNPAMENGRYSSSETQARYFFEANDVCVSNFATIWSQEGAIDEYLRVMVHDFNSDRVINQKVLVTEPSRYLEGAYFLSSTGNTHHSHIFYETLRKLDFIQDNKIESKILAPSILTKSQRDYFQHFGFPDSKCVYRDVNETVKVEKLYFSIEVPFRCDRKSFNFLRNIGLNCYNNSNDFSDRIYFSRRDSRIYRNLVNEDEIEDIFKQFGFQVILASELSALDKIKIMSKAKYVAGPLGAALTYIPFAQNITQIILTSDLYFPPSFLEAANVQMSNVVYIKGIGLKSYSDPWKFEHSSFFVPKKVVAAALKDLFSEFNDSENCGGN